MAYVLSRSGSAGANAGACGTRLQCFKAAITEANAATTPSVERTALTLINVDSPGQDVGLTTPGKQLLIRPDANWNGNTTPDLIDALNKVSLGGMTCFTCAVQAVHRSFFGAQPDSEKARPDSQKVIVFVSERVSTYPYTGYNGLGAPTGYPSSCGRARTPRPRRCRRTCAGAVGGAYSVAASPALAEGAYTARVEQRDGAGNVGSATVAFTVDVPEAGPQAYADSVRADAPAGFWRLGLLDLDTAGVAVEDGGGAPVGAYLGGVVLGVPAATHDEDAAARFDGGNDMVRVGYQNPEALDFGTGDFTAEAWIKPSASDERVIVSKRSSLATEPYWAVTVTDDSNHNGQIRAVFFDGTSTRTAYSSKGVVDGAWHHVAVLFDRDSGITISVDGETKFTVLAMTPTVTNSGQVLIGKGANNPYFKGDIDEVALYSGLLALERIQAHLAAAAA